MKTVFQNQVISRLRVLRTKSNLSQAGVADLLNISAGQVGNIESCHQPHKYTLKQIVLLCSNMGYPVSDVFSESNEHLSVEELINRIVEYEEGTKNESK